MSAVFTGFNMELFPYPLMQNIYLVKPKKTCNKKLKNIHFNTGNQSGKLCYHAMTTLDKQYPSRRNMKLNKKDIYAKIGKLRLK